MLKLGTRRLHIWPGVQGDGAQETSTPYKHPLYKELKRMYSREVFYDPHVSMPPSLQAKAAATTVAEARAKQNGKGTGSATPPAAAAAKTAASSSSSTLPPYMPPPLHTFATMPPELMLRTLQRRVSEYYFSSNDLDYPRLGVGFLNRLTAPQLEQVIAEEQARLQAEGPRLEGAAVTGAVADILHRVRQFHRPLSSMQQCGDANTGSGSGSSSSSNTDVNTSASSSTSSSTPSVASVGGASASSSSSSFSSYLHVDPIDFAEYLELVIDVPPFRHPIIYHHPPAPSTVRQAPVLPFTDMGRLCAVQDPDAFRDNPIVAKYHKYTARRGMSSRPLKPNLMERAQLEAVLSLPVFTKLSSQQKQLLTRFRFFLADNRSALTWYLQTIDWSDPDDTDAREAVRMLDKWVPIGPADALELLSPGFKNAHPAVRAYGVSMVSTAPDEEILSYLLQLVQALRYEDKFPCALSTFLINRCSTSSLELANNLYWYLVVETTDASRSSLFQNIFEHFKIALKTSKPQWVCDSMRLAMFSSIFTR